MKTKKPDNRVRFGWCDNIDDEPQTVFEKFPKHLIGQNPQQRKPIPVAVIPMSFGGKAAQARVRRLVKDYWWPQ